MNKGYIEMAADEAAEAEALEWIEALIGDVADEPHEQRSTEKSHDSVDAARDSSVSCGRTGA